MYKSEYQNIFENQASHWWYLGMGQISTTLLDKYLSKRQNLKILDAGCGTGAAFPYLKKFGQVIGVDISEDALKFARKRGRVIKANITALPFKNNSFDLITCFDVLYHLWVEDYRQAIKEFHRVLKPNGVLFLREPAFEWLKSSHDVIDMAKHRFNRKQLHQALTLNSFRLLKISYTNFLLFPLVLLKRLPEALKLKRISPKSDIQKLPPVMNSLFLAILKAEAQLLRHFNLPWGSSILCLAEKA